MPSYDGDIKLGVELDPKDVKQSANELESEIKKVFDRAAGKKADSSFKQIEIQMSRSVKKAHEFEKALTELEHKKIPTEDYRLIEDSIHKAQGELVKFETKQEELIKKREALQESLTTGIHSVKESKSIGNQIAKVDTQIEAIKGRIQETTNTIKYAEADMKDLVAEGKAFTIGADSDEYDKALRGLEACTNEMRVLVTKASDYSIVMNGSEESIEKTRTKIDSMVPSMEAVDNAEKTTISSVKELYDALDSVDHKAQNIGYDVELIDMNKTKIDAESLAGETDNVRDKIISVSHSLEEVVEAMAKFAATGQISEEEANDISEMVAEIDVNLMDAGQAADYLAQGLSASGEEVERVQKSTTSVIETLGMMPAALGRGFVGLLKTIPVILKKVASVAWTAAKNIGRLAKNLLASAGKAIRTGLSRIGTAIHNIGRNAKTSNFSFGKLLKTLFMYGLGIRSLYALFGKLKSAIKEGLQNLAQFNDGNNETNKAISELISSLNYLKNSLGAAFAPILTTVSPILSRFIDQMAEATNKIGMFFAALSGKNVFTKAKKVQTDYAKSLKNTNKELDEANQKLGEYDKLSVIGQEDKKADESEGPNVQDMFEDVKIPDMVNDWIQKLKDAWANADFTDIGAAIGQKLKDSFDNIPWEDIKEKARRLGKSIATLINGFIEVEGLGETIGRTIAEAFNTALTFLYNLVRDLDWEGVGRFVLNAIVGFFETFEWNKLAYAISQFVNGLVTALNEILGNPETWKRIGAKLGEAFMNLVKSIRWSELGKLAANAVNAVANFVIGLASTLDAETIAGNLAQMFNSAIKNIKWDDVGKAISAAVKFLLDLFINFVEKVKWRELGNKIAEMLRNIEWGAIISKVFEAIGAVLGGLAAFLWGLVEEAWQKVKDWWYDVAYEDGEFTISGLLNGILEAMKNIGNWLIQHVWEPLKKGFYTALGLGSPSKKTKEFGGWLMDGLKNGISGAVQKVVDAVKAVWTKLKAPFVTIANGVIWVINKVIKAVNWMIDGLNKLHIDIPEWTNPLTGTYHAGTTLGFNIKKLSEIQTIKLAEGAVIPPNREFLATLGDQRQGVNVETPLNTMIEAFKTALSEEGSNHAPIVLQLDGKTVAKVVWDETDKKYKQTGKYIPSYA